MFIVRVFWAPRSHRKGSPLVSDNDGDGGPDTVVGRENYQAFLEHIVPTFTKWHMEAPRITWSADGNSAVAECVETIQPNPGEDVLTMHELVEATIGDDGRISKFDLYFKIPDPLPQWVVEANSRQD